MSQATIPPAASQGVIRAKGVAAFLNIGLSTVWKWHAEGKLPPGIRIGPRCTVWRRSDLEAFLERQATANGAE